MLQLQLFEKDCLFELQRLVGEEVTEIETISLNPQYLSNEKTLFVLVEKPTHREWRQYDLRCNLEEDTFYINNKEISEEDNPFFVIASDYEVVRYFVIETDSIIDYPFFQG